MTSVILHKRKNPFSRDLLSGSQDSDDFLLVPTRVSILSTLYPREVLGLVGVYVRELIREDLVLEKYISLESTFIIYLFETTLLTIRLKPSYQPLLGKMSGRRDTYLQFKEDGITSSFCVFIL